MPAGALPTRVAGGAVGAVDGAGTGPSGTRDRAPGPALPELVRPAYDGLALGVRNHCG